MVDYERTQRGVAHCDTSPQKPTPRKNATVTLTRHFFDFLTLTQSVCHVSQAMCFQLRDALRVGCIGFSNKFFSNSMESKEMIKIIDDELRNFCILVEAPKTPFGRPKKTYSGKVGGRNDDVAIVLQLAITGAR